MGFGFSNREDDRKIKFGMEFVDRDSDPYGPHLGKLVEVFAHSTYLGTYVGTTRTDKIVLFPSLCLEHSDSQSIGQGRNRDLRFLNSERPLIISGAEAVSPLRKEYLEKILSNPSESTEDYSI